MPLNYHFKKRGRTYTGRPFGGIARFAFGVVTRPLWFMHLGVHWFTVKNRNLLKMGALSANKNCILTNKFPVSLTYFCYCCCSLFIYSSPPFFFKQQARAEQEEEFISNTLFKKIQALQKEKETLAVNYEKEEEFLTNELSRKLMQVNLSFLPLHLSLPVFLSRKKWLWWSTWLETFADEVVAKVLWRLKIPGKDGSNVILKTLALWPICLGKGRYFIFWAPLKVADEPEALVQE